MPRRQHRHLQRVLERDGDQFGVRTVVKDDDPGWPIPASRIPSSRRT
jgi:hypothetical protein